MIGKQIGSYRLLKLLGRGGMGSVYLAEHVVMHDQWAVKILADEYAERPAIVARFMDEARAAARVRHRNLIRVFHVDRTPEGICYLVMEYLEGMPLSKFIALYQATRSDLVVRLASQIASALMDIHKHGIVHRDVKPDNIFLIKRDTDTYVPIVLDLGVAHLGKGLASGPGTQEGTVIGTPSYSSPEQLLGEPAGPAADLFSLGVMIYELATGGRFPWQLEGQALDKFYDLTPTALFRRIETTPPADPRRYVPAMTDAFATALLAPLAFDPVKRPKDERAYILALAQATPGDEILADGLQLVRDYAPGLLAAEDLQETIRLSAPAIISSAGSDARYVLGEKLGHGGMAEVFAASAVGTAGFERAVAIKRVLPALSAQSAFEAMFIAEARTASRLSHPNIVAVTDFRKDDQGRLFIVMELMDGKDLDAVLAAGPLPLSVIIFVMVEMLRGLGYAHDRTDPVNQSQGVIHRDVSPHNVLVSREGEVKISDFGLSKALDAAGRAISTVVRGKPAFMAPEQVRGKELDRRTDLFAVGIIGWEMLTGTPLFRGSPSETMASVIFKDIELPSVVAGGGIPADLEAIVMQLLQREPAARFQTAGAAIAALLRCRDSRADARDELVRLVRTRFPRPGDARRTVQTVVLMPVAPSRPTASTGAAPTTLGGVASQSVPAPHPGPRRWLLVGLGAGALALASAAAVILITRERIGHPAADAAVVVVTQEAQEPASGDAALVAVTPLDASASAPIPSPDAAVIVTAPTDAATFDAMVTVPGLPVAPLDAGAPPSADAGTRPRPVVLKGDLAVFISPWAEVVVDGAQSLGQTPVHTKLPIGVHRLLLKNPNKQETVTVTITVAKGVVIDETW